MLLCGLALFAGLQRRIGGATDVRLLRHLPGDLRRVRLRHAVARPRPISPPRPGAAARVAALVGLVLVVRPRHDHRPGDRAAVRPPVVGLRRAAVRLRRDRHRWSSSRSCSWLPDDRAGPQIGHGAAMSYPSLATSPTGASVVAATAPRRRSGSTGATRGSGRGSSPAWSPATPRRRPWPARFLRHRPAAPPAAWLGRGSRS